MKKTLQFAGILLVAFSITACGMSHRTKSTGAGAAIGGITGAILSDGGGWGTAAGAIAGGILGNQLGK